MECNPVFALGSSFTGHLFGSSLTSRRLLIYWRKAFESSEDRGDRMFWTSDVDVGDKTRGECRWRLFRVSGGETRRDRAVVVVMVAVVGAEGDDALAPAPVVGPRCQLVSMPWNPDTGSNKPQGTNISYDRSGVLSPVFAGVRLSRLAF